MRYSILWSETPRTKTTKKGPSIRPNELASALPARAHAVRRPKLFRVGIHISAASVASASASASTPTAKAPLSFNHFGMKLIIHTHGRRRRCLRQAVIPMEQVSCCTLLSTAYCHRLTYTHTYTHSHTHTLEHRFSQQSASVDGTFPINSRHQRQHSISMAEWCRARNGLPHVVWHP